MYNCLLLVAVVDNCSYGLLHVVVAVSCLLLIIDGCRCCSLFAVVVANIAVVCGYLLVLFAVVGAC